MLPAIDMCALWTGLGGCRQLMIADHCLQRQKTPKSLTCPCCRRHCNCNRLLLLLLHLTPPALLCAQASMQSCGTRACRSTTLSALANTLSWNGQMISLRKICMACGWTSARHKAESCRAAPDGPIKDLEFIQLQSVGLQHASHAADFAKT